MTTAAHTPSPACYKRGCKQPACLQVGRRYAKHLSVDIARGISRRCDATQARVHIHRLTAHNWSHRQIAEASGVARSTITVIAAGQKTTSRQNAMAILAVQIGPVPAERPKTTDATGTIRRIRGLAWMGYSHVSLSRRLDMTEDRLSGIARGAFSVVRISEARKIAKLYRELSQTPGPNKRAAQGARKKGWHGPLAWDDIDNPDCQPETDYRASRAQASTRPKVYADPARVARLTAAGKSAAQIAQEIGCHQRTVVRARGRAEQLGVAA